MPMLRRRTIAFFSPAPSVVFDASFCWRRLRRTGLLAIVLLTVNAISGLSGPSGSSASRQATAEGAVAERAEIETQVSTSNGPRAVPPVGWRRTSNGWENVADWFSASGSPGGISAQVSLSERIISQQNCEPILIRNLMDVLRRTPPGCFAIGQLICVLTLFLVWNAIRSRHRWIDWATR